MPDKNGALSPEDREKILSWLDERGGKTACPVCHHENWFLAEHILEGRIYSGGGLVVGGPNYPQFVIVCTNCYYARHFMAMPLGLSWEKEPEPEAKKSKSGGGDG